MKRALVAVFAAFAMAVPATGQHIVESPERVAEFIPVPSIHSNSITKLASIGDSLLVGPLLSLTTDDGETWQRSAADSLRGGRNRVFSVDVHGQTVVVGLGYISREGGTNIQSAGGFLVSNDGGRTFDYRFPQLDGREDDRVTFGVSTLEALPVVVPQQSPPFDVAYDPFTGNIWVAGWASGVRVSQDGGRTFRRVVLPPDNLSQIHPNDSYSFFYGPRRGAQGHLNHMGFSVHADVHGNVWAGTPRGINRRLAGSESWHRYSATGSPTSLTGSWVTTIEEQVVDGESIIWMATWNAGDAGESYRDGVTITHDQGETFEQVLIGERVHDFGFDGERIYAAAERGLFISDDRGQTWRSVNRFQDPSRPDVTIRPDVAVYAVEVTPSAVRVGTSDGLMRSADGGDTWQIFRADVPLRPAPPTEQMPEVDTYAYPNPFSPASSGFVRIRYEGSASGGATIRILDYEMQLVRSIEADSFGADDREVTWDGLDRNGLRVSNGVYFYTVESGGRTASGKILVIE
jgi:photosystem II stability/assembly factor-like uncharacterized protein